MAKVSPTRFIQEVRTETSKVSWPTRKETMLTTIMVLIMTTIVALFFLLVDQALGWVLQSLLGI